MLGQWGSPRQWWRFPDDCMAQWCHSHLCKYTLWCSHNDNKAFIRMYPSLRECKCLYVMPKKHSSRYASLCALVFLLFRSFLPHASFSGSWFPVCMCLDPAWEYLLPIFLPNWFYFLVYQLTLPWHWDCSVVLGSTEDLAPYGCWLLYEFNITVKRIMTVALLFPCVCAGWLGAGGCPLG